MRRTFVRLHLWLGITLGFFWAVQGLTGAALVFHREMDRWALADVASGPMASLDWIVAQAEAETGSAITSIGIADRRGDILNVQYDRDGARQLQVDGATGRFLRDRDYDPLTPLGGSFWRWVYNLHEAMLLHDKGETLVGISGLFLFFTVIMGLWIGWPKRGQLRQAVNWQGWRTVRARLFGWHRLSGILAGLLMMVTIPNGIWMVFAKELRPAIASVVEFQLPYRAPPSIRMTAGLSPQAALDRARARFPGAAFVRLTMPTPKGPFYVVRLRQPQEMRAWSGVTSVTIDPVDGAVLSVYDAARAPIANRIADAAFSVHVGEMAGLGGRIAVMLAGLSLPLLYVTGLWAWLRRRRRHRPEASTNARATKG